jgi:hypothetical protein
MDGMAWFLALCLKNENTERNGKRVKTRWDSFDWAISFGYFIEGLVF